MVHCLPCCLGGILLYTLLAELGILFNNFWNMTCVTVASLKHSLYCFVVQPVSLSLRRQSMAVGL